MVISIKLRTRTLGAFNCGNPAHRVRDCPVPSAEHQRPEQQPTPPPQPSAPPRPDVRPMKNNSSKQEKTCIWVKYRQHKLSTLIDTGSDVSIAGEDIARNLGWTIHAHRTKEVSVANNKTMSIHGATRMVLDVAGHDVESEILIAPDLDGLILGIDWLRSQGRIRWDFDRGKIKFGRRNWIELQRETEQPCWASIIRKNSPLANPGIGPKGLDFHAAPTGSVRRFCSSRLNRKFLYEVSLFCCAIHQVESGRERGKSSGLGAIQCVLGIRRRIRDDVFATLSRYPPCLSDLWASYMIVRSARRTLWTLLHFRPSLSGTASGGRRHQDGKDPAELGHSQKSQNNEGKTPGISSTIEIVSPRRDGVFRRELDPYTPASPVKDLATRIADDARPIEVANSAQNRDSGQLRDNVARQSVNLHLWQRQRSTGFRSRCRLSCRRKDFYQAAEVNQHVWQRQHSTGFRSRCRLLHRREDYSTGGGRGFFDSTVKCGWRR